MSSAWLAGVVLKSWKNYEAYQKEGKAGILEDLYKRSFINIAPNSTSPFVTAPVELNRATLMHFFIG